MNDKGKTIWSSDKKPEYIYILTKINEDNKTIRECNILATSYDKSLLQNLMQQRASNNMNFIKQGFSCKEDDYYESNYDDYYGFTAFCIEEQRVI